MAYQSGTITNFFDLWAVMRTFLLANNWTEEPGTPGEGLGSKSVFVNGKCHVDLGVRYAGPFFDGKSNYGSLGNLSYGYTLTHNQLSAGDYRVLYGLSDNWPKQIAFSGAEEDLTFTWVEDVGGRWTVVGGVTGAYADATPGVAYSDRGLTFGWPTENSPASYRGYLDNSTLWENGLAPAIYYLAGQQDQAITMVAGHSSDGAGELNGEPDYADLRYSYMDHEKVFFSRAKLGANNDAYQMYADDIFPLTYHLHASTDPDEFWCVLEDYAQATVDRGPRVLWMGFGGTQSYADEPGFYAVSQVALSTQGDWLYSVQNLGATGSQIWPTLSTVGFSVPRLVQAQIPFYYCKSTVVYDTTIGNRYKYFTENANTLAGTDSGQLDYNTAQLQAPNFRVGGVSSNPVILAPLLYPVALHQDMEVTGSNPNRRMPIAQIKSLRHIEMDYVTHGEVISDGAQNWKCYAGVQRAIGVTTGQGESGKFGFAIRYDGP